MALTFTDKPKPKRTAPAGRAPSPAPRYNMGTIPRYNGGTLPTPTLDDLPPYVSQQEAEAEALEEANAKERVRLGIDKAPLTPEDRTAYLNSGEYLYGNGVQQLPGIAVSGTPRDNRLTPDPLALPPPVVSTRPGDGLPGDMTSSSTGGFNPWVFNAEIEETRRRNELANATIAGYTSRIDPESGMLIVQGIPGKTPGIGSTGSSAPSMPYGGTVPGVASEGTPQYVRGVPVADYAQALASLTPAERAQHLSLNPDVAEGLRAAGYAVGADGMLSMPPATGPAFAPTPSPYSSPPVSGGQTFAIPNNPATKAENRAGMAPQDALGAYLGSDLAVSPFGGANGAGPGVAGGGSLYNTPTPSPFSTDYQGGIYPLRDRDPLLGGGLTTSLPGTRMAEDEAAASSETAVGLATEINALTDVDRYAWMGTADGQAIMPELLKAGYTLAQDGTGRLVGPDGKIVRDADSYSGVPTEDLASLPAGEAQWVTTGTRRDTQSSHEDYIRNGFVVVDAEGNILAPDAKIPAGEQIIVYRLLPEEAAALKAAMDADAAASAPPQSAPVGFAGDVQQAPVGFEGDAVPSQDASGVTLETFMGALSGQESGGFSDPYGAVNEDTGASGKFQFMPDTWAGVAPLAGLPANAPMTPENQEAVARAYMSALFAQYGNWEDVAAVWYSGQPFGYYDPDAPQGGYPTIREYVNSVMARASGGTGQYGERFAGGGYTTAPQLMAGDAAGRNPNAGGAEPEIIFNPTQAPLMILNNDQTNSAMGMPRFASGTDFLSRLAKGAGAFTPPATAQPVGPAVPEPSPRPPGSMPPPNYAGDVPTVPMSGATNPLPTTMPAPPPVTTPASSGGLFGGLFGGGGEGFQWSWEEDEPDEDEPVPPTEPTTPPPTVGSNTFGQFSTNPFNIGFWGLGQDQQYALLVAQAKKTGWYDGAPKGMAGVLSPSDLMAFYERLRLQGTSGYQNAGGY